MRELEGSVGSVGGHWVREGRKRLGENLLPSSVEEQKEGTIPFGAQTSLFILRGGAGKGEATGTGAGSGFFVCAGCAPRPSGLSRLGAGAPRTCSGDLPLPRTARGLYASFLSRPRVLPAARPPARLLTAATEPHL